MIKDALDDSATDNGKGWTVTIPDGNRNIVIRIQEPGTGGRPTMYFRIVKDNLSALNEDGLYNADRVKTHFDITDCKAALDKILNILAKFRKRNKS